MANFKWYTHKIRNFQALFSLIKCYLANLSFHNSLSMGPVKDVCYGRSMKIFGLFFISAYKG